MSWWLPKGDTTRTVGRIFFIKVQSPWEDQLIIYVMRTLMQFFNGSRKKLKLTLLEKSTKE